MVDDDVDDNYVKHSKRIIPMTNFDRKYTLFKLPLNTLAILLL